MEKKYTKYGIGVLVLVGLALIISGSFQKKAATPPGLAYRDSGILCLPNGHTNLAQHIHQMFSVVVDGVAEVIPANLGIEGTCMAEVHTHDTTGKIHVETVDPNTNHTLADFFRVWNQPIERPGYSLVATINGKAVPDPGSHILADDDVISFSYTKQ